MLWQDVKYALRMLAKNPGFTAVAVLTLALGIGANTAIFSLIDQVALRWLPVKHPEQLVEARQEFLIPEYEKLVARTHSFLGIFAYDEGPMIAGIDGVSQNVRGKFVSGTYHSVLGIDALIGRVITPQDDQRGSPLVCVLGYNYWKRRFALSPDILAKTITLKRIPFTIVGVAPDFGADQSADILVPMVTHPQLAMKDNDTVRIVGRLKPELSERQANAELTLIYQQILAESSGGILTPPEQRRILEKRIVLRSAGRGGLYRFTAQLRIVAAVVGMVLLIACANVANLLLVRGAARQREIAVRLTIGAGRWRLIRQLLTESILLALMAGCLGLLLALWGGYLLWALVSEHSTPISPDIRILGFTVAISTLTGIAFGLVPAFRATRVRAAYIPFTQAPPTMTGQAVIEVRTAANPRDIAATMREAAQAIDKDLPLGSVETQDDIVIQSLGRQRSLAQLTSSFGLLALLLASVGLYGTMSYAVGQRTREIGIRMALGAERKNVLKMVLREGLLLTIVGVGLGLALGAALTRLISSQLYNLSATDPATFTAVSVFLVLVALAASYIPARRAMRVDPVVALRYE